MPPLADLQAAFARALRDPKMPAPSGTAYGHATARRFDVHRNNFAASLIDALRASFPGVQKLVGDEFFAVCARVFIDAEPPRSPVLMLYGSGFASFLESFVPAAQVPYLGDVARLEWARLESCHAGDAVPKALSALGNIPAADVASTVLMLHPSLRLVRSRWPVASLWQDCIASRRQSEIDMSRGEDVLVCRPALAVDMHILPQGGAEFVEGLRQGWALGEAAGHAADAVPAFDLATHLQGLFAIGAVAGLKVGGQAAR